MPDKRLIKDERHYPEPEIIPPGEDDPRAPGDEIWGRGRGRFEERGIHRIYVTRVGPFGFLPLALVGGVLTLLFLAFLFGFLLILLPVAGLILAVALIGNFLRGGPRWPR
jgi:pilus assembly protein TadC